MLQHVAAGHGGGGVLTAAQLEVARRRERQARWRSTRVALGFIGPAALSVSVMLLLPVFFVVYLSFTRWARFSGLDRFAGFANYTRLFGAPYFGDAMVNTALWVGAALVLPLSFGLGLAMLLGRLPMQDAFKSAFFLPRVVAPTAAGVIWSYVYAPDGLVNWVIGLFTGTKVSIGWLYQANTITPAVITGFVWQSTGLSMVLILLGLAAIPRDPLEAARLEGASDRQIFTNIIWPLLLPTVMVVTIIAVVAGFTVFDLLWVMGGNYPGKRSLSLSVYMYFESFGNNAWAFGAAIAVMLGSVVLVVTWMQAIMQHRIDRRLH
jgi:multiple sugar transport system permease protein